MNSYSEDLKGIFKNVKVKRPKFSLPKIDWSTITIKRPSRTFCIAMAILIEIILVFVAFWLFDDRTTFANDYLEKRSYGSLSKWGWVHKAVATMLILAMIAWFFAIVNEFAAYNEDKRTFYKLYHKNRY